MNEPDLFDACDSRHKGNAQSIKANPSASIKTRDRDAVYGLIASDGITSKEIAEAMGKVDLSKPYLTTQEAESHRNRCPNRIGITVRIPSEWVSERFSESLSELKSEQVSD